MELFDAIVITLVGFLFILGYVVIGMTLVYGIFKLILRIKDMKLYGKTLWFRRGVNITLFLSYRCNIYCPYCSLAQINGKYPQGEELTLEQWKEKFDRGFPVKIKEVYLSGGEPSLVPYIAEFANYLIDKGYHVCLFSNLARVDRL